MPSAPITLIVGLGNPGDEYAQTRHNAGAWFAQSLAHHFQLSLKPEKKFKGLHTLIQENNARCHVLLPTTFMNHSGQAVKAICDFYQIAPQHILIAHDELDLISGDIRLKFAGGHGGHNGLRDIIAHLHSHDFYRLRIGIDHPRNSTQEDVADYVLHRPSKTEYQKIDAAINNALSITDLLLKGEAEKAMQQLHTKKEE